MLNPLKLEDMFSLTNEYFVERDDKYNNTRKFHRNVKYKIYGEHISEECKIIDVGAGKGQDIHRYNDKKMSALVAIEPVFDSLHELQNRLMSVKYKTNSPSLMCIPTKGEDY